MDKILSFFQYFACGQLINDVCIGNDTQQNNAKTLNRWSLRLKFPIDTA